MKRILIIIVLCFAMTGCVGNNSGSGSEDETGTQTDVVTLDRVKESFKAGGLELLPFVISNENANHGTVSPADPAYKGDREQILNKVKPNRFIVTRPTVDQNYVEELYVYIYDSKESREDGEVEFKQENQNMNTPLIYVQKNVLLLYWPHSNESSLNEAINKFMNAI